MPENFANSLTTYINESPHNSAQALMQGVKDLQTQHLSTALENSASGDYSFYERLGSARRAVQKKLNLSDADLMAHCIALDFARDGRWDEAWQAMAKSPEWKNVERADWEMWMRDHLLNDVRLRNQLVPL